LTARSSIRKLCISRIPREAAGTTVVTKLVCVFVATTAGRVMYAVVVVTVLIVIAETVSEMIDTTVEVGSARYLEQNGVALCRRTKKDTMPAAPGQVSRTAMQVAREAKNKVRRPVSERWVEMIILASEIGRAEC